jgi:hypothetical protein
MGFFGGGGAAPANMGGATSSAAGTAGLVPAPAAGDDLKVLSGDATFKFPCEEILPNGVQAGGFFGPIGCSANWAGGASSLSANIAYAQPIWVSTEKTISTLRFRLNSSSTANIRGGIYTPRSDGLAGNLKTAEFGPAGLTGVSTGMVGLTSASTITLRRGLYWGVLLSDGTPNLSTVGANYMWMFGNNDSSADIYPGFRISQTYGAMPSSFTGTWTKQNSIATFFYISFGF